MLDSLSDMAVAEGIIALAKAFSLAVIAEGVESILLGETLVRIGCECAQGYIIARPMPADLLPDWHWHWRPFDGWQKALRIRQDDMPALLVLIEMVVWQKQLSLHCSLAYLQSSRDKVEGGPHHASGFPRFEQWLGHVVVDRAEQIDRIDTIDAAYR